MDNRSALAEINDTILIAGGFDEAIIGFIDKDDCTVALYDTEKCLEILISRDGMSHEEAEEYFDYNVIRSLVYLGNEAPVFATLF